MNTEALWAQFRRLVLGTVVELFVAEKLPIDVGTLSIQFDTDSRFEVPRFNNYMRFKGEVKGALLHRPDEAVLRRLEASLRRVWPELLTVVDIPIGDKLTVENALVSVSIDDSTATPILRLRFDLSAD
jgi:hypothetical protein